MSSFAIYAIGYAVLIIGLAIAAFLLGAPPVWIAVGAVILAGIGLITGATSTRRRDKPESAE